MLNQLFYLRCLVNAQINWGAPYLLIESGALKRGSINGFIKGKSYNRGKIIHWLLSVSMQVLHFKGFLNRQCDHLLNLTLQHEISVFNELKNSIAVNISKKLSCILEAYTSFCDKASTGNHGKTAQYWMGYIHLVNLYQIRRPRASYSLPTKIG